MENSWKNELWSFFETRSREIQRSKISMDELCYISGKEPRLWTDQAIYGDMVESIRTQLDLRPDVSLLEVGCAAGFLAYGLAPLVQTYVGMDLSAQATAVAQRLRLGNARYLAGDGFHLPFRSGSLDRVICYDVFTNFPDVQLALQITAELLRVVKPGGRVMIGSLTEDDRKEEFQKVVAQVNADLDRRYGVLAPYMERRTWWDRLVARLRPPQKTEVTPRITGYYFKKADFTGVADGTQVRCEIHDIHRRNPYFGFRFNVLYTKA